MWRTHKLKPRHYSLPKLRFWTSWKRYLQFGAVVRGANELKHRNALSGQENAAPLRTKSRSLSPQSSTTLARSQAAPSHRNRSSRPLAPPCSSPEWAEIRTVEEAREVAMLSARAAKPQRKPSSTFQTVHRAPSKAEVRHGSEMGRGPSPRRGRRGAWWEW